MDHVAVDETSRLLTEAEDPKKKQPTPLPKLQIAILALLQLAEPTASHCIYPFINQLIIDFDITGGDEKKVGYYAGMIESIFSVTEAAFVFQWGRLSDHIGRKPVLLTGMGGLTISMICFGLSKTFVTLALSRSVVGMLNGNAGVMKSMIGELTDETNMAQGFAWTPVSWAIGTTIAPLMGGQLSRPHDRWPQTFSHPFWIKYPYFLPCAVSASFSALTFLITAVFLKETVKRRSPNDPASSEAGRQDDGPPPLRSVLIRPVIISIANYGVLSLTEMALVALLPLFYAIPISLGGLGLDPRTIGTILGTLGIVDGIWQALFFAKIVDTWSPKLTFQVGLAMLIPSFLILPVMNLYAKAHGLTWIVWACVAVQMCMIICIEMAFGSIFIFITSSVPDKRSLGAVHGVSQFVASTVRAIGPVMSTSLFSTSLERNLLGGYAVYFILVLIHAALFSTTFYLPQGLWPKPTESQEREDRM